MRRCPAVQQLCAEIGVLATTYGWCVMTSPSGFVILTNGVTLLVAAVADTGQALTPEQALWVTMLLHLEIEHYVWRPEDLAHLPQLLDRRTR